MRRIGELADRFDLHDFLFPKPDQAVTAAPGEAFGTEAIFNTLDRLNQRVDPLVIGGPANTGPQPPSY